MQENNENKDIVEVEHDYALAREEDFSPAHFEYLERLFHKMHNYQYRHIRPVTIKQVFIWFTIMSLLIGIKIFYVSASGVKIGLGGLFAYYFFISLAIGAVSVFSKCLTRIYYFKHVCIKVFQIVSFYTSMALLAPVLLFLNRVNSAFEVLYPVIQCVALVAIIYYMIYSFMPYKWLKKASQVYAVIVLLGLIGLSSMDGFNHYLFRDNEVYTYSDFETGNSRDISSIDEMVDGIVSELDD